MIVEGRVEPMHEQIEKYGVGTSTPCRSCRRLQKESSSHPVHLLWELCVSEPSKEKRGEYIYVCSFCDVQQDQRH